LQLSSRGIESDSLILPEDSKSAKDRKFIIRNKPQPSTLALRKNHSFLPQAKITNMQGKIENLGQ
jgi:hypothetical protein